MEPDIVRKISSPTPPKRFEGFNYTALKRFLFGEPFPTSKEHHERLDKIRALAVFASDPISSNAYATEAIMSILVLIGSAALSLTMPIALGIAALILLIVFSYTQTIMHYPGGGGAYIVASDNLGTMPSLLAGAALLTDYVLTVSVSVSAGVRAITSAFPAVHDYRVLLAVLAIGLITWANLRGIRESGTIFAFPTYAFVGGVAAVIIIGLVRYFGLFGAAPLGSSPPPAAAGVQPVVNLAYTWLILRAFAAGCTALTGIEAISDGVQAFKKPEARNAAITMMVMGGMALSLFIGITFLATHLHLMPREEDSILSQMARTVTGGGFMYYWVQAFTTLILILAANTGFQDFPRLGSFLARDGFLPRWIQNRGDRLVFNYGILLLAFVASVLVIIFRADEIKMLPLYALGVMISFTVSQTGMAKLMSKVGKVPPGETVQTKATTIHYEAGWRWKQALSALGALTTGMVLLILIVTKFTHGAWIVVLTVVLLIWGFRAIRAHYDRVAEALSTRNFSFDDILDIADVVIIPMADVHRGTLRALKYASRLSHDVRAVSVITSEENKERFMRRWNRFPELTEQVKLVLIEYDFRDILEPLVAYIQHVNEVECPHQMTTIVVPEFIPSSIWAHFLHNQTANILRFRLRGYKDIVVIDVPYHV